MDVVPPAKSADIKKSRTLWRAPKNGDAKPFETNGNGRLVAASPKKSSRKKWIVIIVILLAVGVFVFTKLTASGSSNMVTATVKRGPFNIVVVETGELEAKHSVSITAPVLASGGRAQLAIQYMAPEAVVDSGTLVVSFDPADQMKIIGDKQNELKLAQSDLSKLKVQQAADESQAKMDFENAKLQFELAKIASDGMKFESESKQREAQLELRKAELQYQQSEQSVKSKASIQKSELSNLELKVEQLQSIVDRATADMEKLSVKAPSSGLIVYQNSWSTGKKLSKGDQVWNGQPIAILPDLSQMQAAVQVNEVDIAKVKKDQQVEIVLDAFPDKKFQGKVVNVASIGSPKDNNPSIKVFKVLVDINGADSVLRPGMTVSARVMVDKIDNVLSIPLESVFDDNGKTVTYVQNGSSFTKREITLGEKNENFVVVKSGLKEGEKVSMTDPTQDASGGDEKENNANKSSSRAQQPKVQITTR